MVNAVVSFGPSSLNTLPCFERLPQMSILTTTPPLPASGELPPERIPTEPPRRRWWMAKRVLLAAVGIMLLTGASTYVAARDEVGKVVEALGQNKPVKLAAKVLVPTSKGEPETVLLVGNDERPPPKDNPSGAVLPHSNEMLLVRIDPSKPTISMLSIPRELRVTFTAPNGEVITNRINSVYTYGSEGGGGTSGGTKLMLETIKSVLGITVNHVFVTNFPKFKRAVDEMGCVYMTVDKRYYHVNEPGGEQYFEIDLQPGYQRLCGRQALEFVANRHESTSVIRDARDQRFLLAVKAQYGYVDDVIEACPRQVCRIEAEIRRSRRSLRKPAQDGEGPRSRRRRLSHSRGRAC